MIRRDVASLALKNRAPSSASVALEITALMMDNRTRRAPLWGGEYGSFSLMWASGLSLRKK